MLTPSQLRALIQQTQAFQRANALYNDEWSSIDHATQFGHQLIQIEDLQFMIALASKITTTPKLVPTEYSSVIQFINLHGNDLSAGSKQWLLRLFTD